MPAKITLDLTVQQANTVIKGLHHLRNRWEGVDKSIHATDQERRTAWWDMSRATEILEELDALDFDPTGEDDGDPTT